MATTYVDDARLEEDEAAPIDAAAIRSRLVQPMPSRLAGWVGPLVVTALAGLLRFWRLGVPHSIVFDETYYVHDSMSLLKHGVELDASSGDHAAGYVVHPPLGKWMIAFGEWLFGSSDHFTGDKKVPWTYVGSFGWRFSSAVVGTLAVLILARVARRMTRSNLLGCVAGLLLAVEALAFVESRTALLDIFLMFWVLAGFACLVADRDAVRARYASAVRDDGSDWRADEPSGLGPRWWLVGAGVCVGAACAVKWDAVWFMPAFVALAVAWEAGARRTAGLEPWGRRVVDAGWWYVVGAVSLLPVIKFYNGWVASVATAGAFLALWELAALRPAAVGARRAVTGAWGVLALATLAGAYHVVRFGDTKNVQGTTRSAEPPRTHWTWLAIAVLLVAITWWAGRAHPHPARPGLRRLRERGWQVPIALGVAPASVYVASWTGWFANSRYAYGHDAYVTLHQGTLAHWHAVFKGWLSYHFQAYWFHSHLYSPHRYASRPLSWLVTQRPVAYFFDSPANGVHGCTASGGCDREILAMGSPAIFWAAIPALLVLLWLWAARRDWRAGGVLACFAVGYLSWFPFSAYIPGTGSKSRTEFLFYVLDVLPFMILAVTLTLGLVLGGHLASPRRRLFGSATAGAYVLTAVVLFFYFYPVLAAIAIPKGAWDDRMWFSSWV